MWASFLGHVEVVKQLVTAGADIDVHNRVGNERRSGNVIAHVLMLNLPPVLL